jgi:hypothetical protein
MVKSSKQSLIAFILLIFYHFLQFFDSVRFQWAIFENGHVLAFWGSTVFLGLVWIVVTTRQKMRK